MNHIKSKIAANKLTILEWVISKNIRIRTETKKPTAEKTIIDIHTAEFLLSTILPTRSVFLTNAAEISVAINKNLKKNFIRKLFINLLDILLKFTMTNDLNIIRAVCKNP
jgi:hypothetical protein